MSLINQALRKAQRDRTPERMPTGASQPGLSAKQGYSGSSTSSGFRPALIIGLALTVAVLIGLVVGLSIVLFTGDSTAQPPSQANATQPPERLAPVKPAASEPIEPQMTPPASSRAPAESTAPDVVAELRRAREAAVAKAQAEAQAAAEAAAEAEAEAAAAQKAASAKPSREVIEWLGASKISGVRLSGSDSRVILNGNAYSVGDEVNFSLGLKVLVIQETRILFEDRNGKKYMKRL
jgi:rRNA maturation endonuclease Nob1